MHERTRNAGPKPKLGVNQMFVTKDYRTALILNPCSVNVPDGNNSVGKKVLGKMTMKGHILLIL